MKLMLSHLTFEHITFDDIACYEEQFNDWMSYVTILGLTLKESGNGLDCVVQAFKTLLDEDNDYDEIILESPKKTLHALCKQLQITFPSTCLHYKNKDRLTPQKLYGLLLLYQYAFTHNLPLQPIFLNDILIATALLNNQLFALSMNCRPDDIRNKFEYGFLLKPLTGLETHRQQLIQISSAARAFQETLFTFSLERSQDILSFHPTITRNPIFTWTNSLAQKYPHHPLALVATRATDITQIISLLFDPGEHKDALENKLGINAAAHGNTARGTQRPTTRNRVDDNTAVDQGDTDPTRTQLQHNNNKKPLPAKKKNEDSQHLPLNKTRIALYAAGALGMAALVYQLCQLGFSGSSKSMSASSPKPSSNKEAPMSDCIKTFLNISSHAH